MEDEPKITKSGVHPFVVLGIFAAICVFIWIALYSRPSGVSDTTNTATTSTGTPQTQDSYTQNANSGTNSSGTNSAQQNGTLAEQQQCNTDGKAFTQNWFRTNFPLGGGWQLQNDPTYHFSTKLNTCLANVSAIYVPSVSAYDTTTFSEHEYYIFEIYSNTPILQSNTQRTCTVPQDTNSTNNCSEMLSNVPLYNNITNLGSNDFISQAQVIMSQ